MPFLIVPLSRSWAWPVAGFAMCVGGCARPEPPQDRLVARAEQAVADLERLQPRLAKAGTPGAEDLAERLGAVREGLSTLPASVPTAVSDPATIDTPPAEPLPTARVRCPDDGCWRLGVQFEAGLWHVHLRGGGGELDDTGPLAFGLAIGLEHARPIDHRLEWSWGGEAVGSWQRRTNDQHLRLIGVRPIIRAAVAVSDNLALTIRPLVEIGQASIRLGDEPGGVLDRADVYAALGLRAGWRWRLADGDFTGEIGWRHVWFNASASALDYRVDIDSPELAAGWSRRF